MTDNRTTELMPCPFCGGEAEICEGGINGKMRVYGLVEHKDSCFFLADGLPMKYQHIMESEFDAWNARAERTCRMEYQTGRDNREYIVKCKEFVGISGKTMKFPEYIDLNQEIVRCRDCKRIEYCSFVYEYDYRPNGFCAWGER